MAIQPGVGYTFTASSQGENINVTQPWSQWTNVVDQDNHPFRIVNVFINVSGGSSKVRYQVTSGAINNLVPVIDDVISGTTVKLDRATAGVPNPPTGELSSSNYYATTKTSYITLRTGPSASTGVYPDTDDTTSRYPVIIAGNVPVTADTDTQGFITIGSITVDDITTPTTFTVSQNVTGSLWADRIKMAGITARYYYARI